MAVEPQSHMIGMPKGFLALRVFQMIFAVFVLGVCIYGAIGTAVSGIILNIFTALATIITLIYILVATYSQPIIYQYWAILSLEIFCLIFWLISFALLASEVAIAAAYTCGGGYYYYGYYYKGTCDTEVLGVIGLFGACAGAGGIEFVLFIVSLAMFSVRLSRHRSNGGHSTPGALATAPPYNQNGGAGQEKVEMQPQVQSYPVAAAPAQNGYYHAQAGDARYGAAPVDQNGQQFQPVHQQTPQQVPQQLAAPQGQFAQQPAYAQQPAPAHYQQQQVMPQ